MKTAGQFLQALLLRMLPALVAFACFDAFKDFEPTPEYKNSGAYLLLGGMWLFNGPAWRTAAHGVRWRAWLHAGAFGAIMVGSGVLFFLVLHSHWGGLWTLLLGIIVLASGPVEPKPAATTIPTADNIARAPTSVKSGRRRWLVYVAAAIGFVALAGAITRLAHRPVAPVAVQQTNAPAESTEDPYSLAWRYRDGDGVPQDYAQAAAWFQCAADRGLAEAYYDLAVLQENGLGVTTDLDRARFNYQQAAGQNYAPALTRLGMLALADDDWPTAITQLENAARLGDPWAEYGLGSAHLAHRAEEESSIVDALVWLELARRHGVEPVKGLLQHIWATVPDDEYAAATDEVWRRVEAMDSAPPAGPPVP